MATYYNITATIAFDTIEADSPQEAAAKAYREITYQPAPATPERILVWETEDRPEGGVKYTSTAWTFNENPQQIVYVAPEPVEAKPVTDAPLTDAPTDAPPAEVEVEVSVETDAPLLTDA